MELFGACIGLGLLAFVAVGVLLGWIAYIRVGRIERRLLQAEDALRAARTATLAPAPPLAPAPGVSGASTAAAVDLAHESRSGGPLGAPPLAAAPDTPPGPPAPLAPPPSARARLGREEPSGPASASAEPSPAPPVAAAGAAPARDSGPAQPASPRAPTARPAPPGARPFELERWLGVRGAAVLGGVFLAIAGFLFVQHSIERGWITPGTRVILAAIAGTAAFIASFPLRARQYAIVANALAGAGVVILYAASWAASMLYGFVAPLAAFACMGAVTAACVLVAWRHGTLLVAVLGLVGGFATPFVLSTGEDRPFALFGYVLLLDLAFLFLAGKRRWPAVATLALVGTTVVQGAWVLARMDPEEAWLGLAVLALFALTFATFAAARTDGERRSWLPAQAGAVLLPFAFGLYFASSFTLAIPLGALVLLAALLVAAAGVLARRDAMPWLSVGAASGSAALLFTWSITRREPFSPAEAWTLAGSALALAALAHAFAEWRRSDGTRAAGSIAGAATSALAALVVAAQASIGPGALQPWPWIAAVAGGALLLQRQAALADGAGLAAAGASTAGAILVLQSWSALQELAVGPRAWIAAVTAALGAALLVAAHLRRGASRSKAFLAVATYCLFAMLAVSGAGIPASPERLAIHVLALAAVLLLAVLTLAAASGARNGAAYLLAVVIALAGQLDRVTGRSEIDLIAASTHWPLVVGLLLATTAIFAVWPFATRASWRGSALAWCAAALQPLAWAALLAPLVQARWGRSLDFVTPLVFAAGAALVARAAWRAPAETEEQPRRVQRAARVSALITALWFTSSIVPIHVDRDPLALSLAFFAAALAAAWARFDSRVLKWTAALALALALALLVLRRETWGFPVPPRAVLNWNLWTYLAPAACAAFAAATFGRREPERARGFELAGLFGRRPVASGSAGLAAILLVFTWINVEIAARFAVGDRAGFEVPHERGRALASSIAWAAYALVLLALGVVRSASGPRWASLVLFLVTIGKVFLFDLGHLAGLQRAASMLGLALSLILVSLVYQRFVFRRPVTDGTTESS
ncbi:MAG: DUF2339 domain-containing protein [Planctomycetes bacterium]|nr:DUF2339 domain-containing protein [Planctomycetota bacterium]